MTDSDFWLQTLHSFPAMNQREGLLFVVSAPSGAGKTSLTRQILAEDSWLGLSVSATTRPRRPKEEEGVHYYFLDPQAFEEKVQAGEFLEWADVFNNRYGTPRPYVLESIHQGRDILFDIDWQGYLQIKEALPEKTVGIFILPPSTKTLESRLQKRGQDTSDIIALRLREAQKEMNQWEAYDYILVNDDFTTCLRELKIILYAERLRTFRQKKNITALLDRFQVS